MAEDPIDPVDAGVTTVASFEVQRHTRMAADGTVAGSLPSFANETVELVRMYRAMVRTRTFDEVAVGLQRTGRLGTFASSLGQEAVAVGIGAAMTDSDVLVPSFREQGVQLWRGATPVELLLYWGGDERGSDFAVPHQDFPVCIPIGSHPPHAVGVALAFQLRNEPRVAVCVLGDGATSKGDVYEAMNYAGLRHLPVVFVVNNNQWAISVPRSAQTAAVTLAQKSIAAGVAGEQVDGNDVIAVRERISLAVERARSGGGSTLVEALTYRLADHTTADDAGRYRSDEEVGEAWKREPVVRLRSYLMSNGLWTDDDEQEVLTTYRQEMNAAAEEYLATPSRSPASMFDHLYETLPAVFAGQRAAVAERTGVSYG